MPGTRYRFVILFFTVLIDLIGFGIIIPILPYYAQRLGAGGLGVGLLFGIYSGMQFLATALLGRLSDRIGRRPILLTTIVLNVGGCLLFAASHTYVLVFFARVVLRLGRGNVPVAQAYAAVLTRPARRSRATCILGPPLAVRYAL